MFVFFHGYTPDTWEAMVKTGLIRKNAGIRFCQSVEIDEELKFNNLAKKGGKLYEIVKENKYPFYIDRLQGGSYIDNYPYDEELVNEYKEMLGEKFYGFQMHEWLSNYWNDALNKLGELSKEDWNEDNIKKIILDKFPGKHLFLEAMTAEEMAEAGKPNSAKELFDNMTSVFEKRQKLGELLPCDSVYLAYQYELSKGVKRLFPEVGAQVSHARVQICYARGMTRCDGKSFGIYYEPWGGDSISTCMYNNITKNEWGIGENSDFPFKPAGANGGSSRSLQKRIFLYAYLNNAEFISEEWGVYNTFCDCEEFALSPYGKVKKEFLDFVDKYQDIGEKLAPIAAVLPEELPVLNNYFDDKNYIGFPVKSEELAKAKKGVREIFASSLPMTGNETATFKNTEIPDAVDLLNRNDEMLKKYDFVVDLTSDSDFSKIYTNICEIDEVKEKLKELLPCYVESGLHWLVNKCTTGGYYLTVFNHSGIVRNVAEGEYRLPGEEKTVGITFKGNVNPVLCDGDGEFKVEDGRYFAVVPAGGFVFIKF